MFDDEWWPPVDIVLSPKVKGFYQCGKCERLLFPEWAKDKRGWKFCPYCGREFRKAVTDGEADG